MTIETTTRWQVRERYGSPVVEIYFHDQRMIISQDDQTIRINQANVADLRGALRIAAEQWPEPEDVPF